MNAATAAACAVSVFAVDPLALGGVVLRSPAHLARDQWLSLARAVWPSAMPWRRVPCNVPDDRLFDRLDLARTLSAGRPVSEPGLLTVVRGGVMVLSMAERAERRMAAVLSAALDAAELSVIALDEGIDDERLDVSLLDRLALVVDLSTLSTRTPLPMMHEQRDINAARALLPQVGCDDDLLQTICATAAALGAGSLRMSLLALRVARISAALDGRREVCEPDVTLAAHLVLAPRASQLPAPQPGDMDAHATAPEPDAVDETTGPTESIERVAEHPANGEMAERVVAAAQAAIPPGLLAVLQSPAAGRARPMHRGRSGDFAKSSSHGRPVGIRPVGETRRARLNVLATLQAAAPWQRLRTARRDCAYGAGTRLRISREDLRATRYRQRKPTLTIFAVDASGSAALHRLAEAKGAVQLLLAECYVRRDQVAVLGFRGRTCELLLPPTRSLVRAKRCLSGLPGGGGTPLASAIDASIELALQSRRRGESPTVVLLTDGRANIARDGRAGRELAHADAIRAARTARQTRVPCVFIDTSPRASDIARTIAAAMGSHYVALPFSNAAAVARVVGSLVTAAAPA